jgi:hypothetical protein
MAATIQDVAKLAEFFDPSRTTVEIPRNELGLKP